jgi:heterotetrameric sarcosine oxidase delta subunit
MLRISCPWCGERDESEFRYRGDASRRRPQAAAGLPDFVSYVFERDNRRGWHLEWWLHSAGCGQLLQVQRHTLTHQIAWVGLASAAAPLPPAEEP